MSFVFINVQDVLEDSRQMKRDLLPENVHGPADPWCATRRQPIQVGLPHTHAVRTQRQSLPEEQIRP